MAPNHQFSSASDLIRFRTETQPDKPAFIFTSDGQQIIEAWTYEDVLTRASQVAAFLQAQGVAPGERTALLLVTAQEYVSGLLGSLMAGVVPMLLFPPRPGKPLTNLSLTAADSEARYALVNSQMLAFLQPQTQADPVLNKLNWLKFDEVSQASPDSFHQPKLSGQDLAALAYTSGSTREPKGVMFSHSGILESYQALAQTFSWISPGPIAFWAPLHHVGGLAASFLPLVTDRALYAIPPAAFIEKPSRLLWMVHKYRLMIVPSATFGFRLILGRTTPEELQGLDLSCWKLAFVGSEKADPATLEAFAARMAPYGFRRSAISNAYGLTESLGIATLNATEDRGFTTLNLDRKALENKRVQLAQPGDEDTVPMVGCSTPVPTREILIVNPETRIPCQPDEVGEVWMRSSSLAMGYWKQPELTERTFQSYLVDSGEGPYLHTSDLGFIRDGELYITGRISDIIILQSRNFYATDFEAVVGQCHPALQPGNGAAVPVLYNGEEHLVIIHEIQAGAQAPDGEAIAQAIHAAIAQHFDQPVAAVALVISDTLPRTALGKIQRFRCLQAFEKGELDTLHVSLLPGLLSGQAVSMQPTAPRTAIERALVGIARGVLGLENRPERAIGVEDNFFTLGGNSLQAAQFVTQVHEVFQVDLTIREFLEHPTIANLAEKIENARKK